MAPAECGTLGSLFLPSSASGLLCSRSGSAAPEMCLVQVSSCTPGLPISRVLPAGVSLLPPPCVQRICLELELLPGQLLQELVCSDMGNVPLKISLLCWSSSEKHPFVLSLQTPAFLLLCLVFPHCSLFLLRAEFQKHLS